ncbi:hypothetical protein ScalyP_jg11587 [Parmales sp. scaly parma]|nr:hypothetical protein ScalyP_jg11587 [Parmales sp. scaly parma]
MFFLLLLLQHSAFSLVYLHHSSNSRSSFLRSTTPSSSDEYSDKFLVRQNSVFDANHFTSNEIHNEKEKIKNRLKYNDKRSGNGLSSYKVTAVENNNNGDSNSNLNNNTNTNNNNKESPKSKYPPPTPPALQSTPTPNPNPDPQQSRKQTLEEQDEFDQVWKQLLSEAKTEAEKEPLLVSFLFSSILNHKSLESALAFHMANRLMSSSMMSTQVQVLFLEALENSPTFKYSLRKDMMAVMKRDPACTCLPDVFLYFKGFHALQTYRVANYLWRKDRKVLAQYFQSQMSQVFQIDIHPNATLGSGIMLDHGTGIVIGETAIVGDNVSMLHHVTLGGSGKVNTDRHPKVGSGVLIGAGASVLGNIKIGDGVQIGAGSLVIEDVQDNNVVVGVPAKVIGKNLGTEIGREAASEVMNQVLDGYVI